MRHRVEVGVRSEAARHATNEFETRERCYFFLVKSSISQGNNYSVRVATLSFSEARGSQILDVRNCRSKVDRGSGCAARIPELHGGTTTGARRRPTGERCRARNGRRVVTLRVRQAEFPTVPVLLEARLNHSCSTFAPLLGQDHLVQSQIRDRAPKRCVLRLQILSPLDPDRPSARRTPDTSDNASPQSRIESAPTCLAMSAHRTSQRSLTACDASSASRSSRLPKTYLRVDQFIGVDHIDCALMRAVPLLPPS